MYSTEEIIILNSIIGFLDYGLSYNIEQLIKKYERAEDVSGLELLLI